jgi:hypothetical protein
MSGPAEQLTDVGTFDKGKVTIGGHEVDTKFTYEGQLDKNVLAGLREEVLPLFHAFVDGKAASERIKMLNSEAKVKMFVRVPHTEDGSDFVELNPERRGGGGLRFASGGSSRKSSGVASRSF